MKIIEKTDAIISFIIGFFIGLFFLIILKNIGIDIPYLWSLMIIFPPLALLGMFIASWLGKRFLVFLQVGRFLLVGVLNTLIDLGILNILIWISGIAMGAWYSVFKGISFVIATINSYFWNKHWTFKKREESFSSKEFSKFLIMTAIGLFINVSIASFVVNVIGPQFDISKEMWATIGAFLATLLAWVWNFFSSKFIVFKK